MDAPPQVFNLEDADGSKTEFKGWRLGSGTSNHSGTQRRWSELHVYKTVGGNYLVHKIGRSVAPGEVNRYTLHISEGPDGAVESCKTSDKDSALFFTRVARDALEQAIAEDPELSDAFYQRKLA
jgi:hypothetical protein